ncbi:MAG TPA: hypothetical protein VGV12_10770 [Gemmatimonadales bacterium]|nr:hypothetical protein [Gemmatimonadales bacterium]
MSAFKERPVRTWQDLTEAFTSGSVRTASDETLLEYLELCSALAMHNDRLDALSINRVITINALLTQSFLRRENQATGKLTWIVIVLAVLNVIGIGVQIWLATRH